MDPQSLLIICLLCFQGITSVYSSWDATVEPKIDALISSCVVLPCEFGYPKPQLTDSKIRGIWHKKDSRNDVIYQADQTRIMDSFKGRTRLLDHLGLNNCTLEIDKVQDHDISQFCFRAEIDSLDKYSFVESCTSLNIKLNAENPKMDHDESVVEGDIAFFKCFVRHTCPSHHPFIKWDQSLGTDSKIQELRKYNGHGIWEVESTLTFKSTEEDDHKEVTCTSTFHGGETTKTTRKIFIKRKAKLHHIIIPVAAVLGTVILFGGVCFYMTRRYKQQIQALQSRDGVWSRLSRMSRRTNLRSEPNRNVNSKSNNCVSNVSGSVGFSKPRVPSPKSEPKSYNKTGGGSSADYDPDDYTNMADMNVYGNV